MPAAALPDVESRLAAVLTVAQEKHGVTATELHGYEIFKGTAGWKPLAPKP